MKDLKFTREELETIMIESLQDGRMFPVQYQEGIRSLGDTALESKSVVRLMIDVFAAKIVNKQLEKFNKINIDS